MEITSDLTKNKHCQAVCNLCNRATNHVVCCSLKCTWGDDLIQGADIYEIIRCLGCDSISFKKTSSDSENYDIDHTGRTIYPEVEEIYPNRLIGRTLLSGIYSLPISVRSVYMETHTALCTKLKLLSGVGIRILVEAVCIEESAVGNTLEKKIDDLVEKGKLTHSNADILHKTRLLGNRSAHEAKPPTEQELDAAFNIVENLLETVYIIPEDAERLR